MTNTIIVVVSVVMNLSCFYVGPGLQGHHYIGEHRDN